MMEINHIIKIIRISKVWATLEITEIEIIKEIFKLETGHMTEMIEKALVGVEGTVDLGNGGRSTSRDRCKERKCHYCREPGHFIRECQKKEPNQVKQREQKA